MARRLVLGVLTILVSAMVLLPLGVAAQTAVLSDRGAAEASKPGELPPGKEPPVEAPGLPLDFVAGSEAVATGYGWSQTSGTYTGITGGTVHGTASNDDQSFNAVNLGFTFTYDGVAYTQVSLQSNGFLAMGATVSNSYTPLSTGSTNNVIAAIGRDLQGNGTTSELMSLMEGVAPNRVFTVQWKHYKRYGTAYAGDDFNFQIKLYETSNLVRIVYGDFTAVFNASPPTVQVGLRGATNTDFNNRTGTGAWTSSAAGTLNNATMALTSTFYPPSGLTWDWTVIPPSPSFVTSTKTAPTQALMGDPVAYTVNIVNSGTAAATAATMVDPIPAGATYNADVTCSAGTCGFDGANVTWSGTVAIGETVTVSFSVDTDGAPCGTLVNQATLNDPSLFGGPITRSASTQLVSLAPTPLDGFEVSVPPPGWTETIVNDPGTDPDWSRVTTGTNPTIAPRGGTAMAMFNSFTCPSTASARLWTNALDLSGYAAPAVVFWMSHDTGYSTNADRVQVQVSLDGTTWVDVGSPILRYDASYAAPGWGEHVVALPAGYNVNGVYVGFLGISGFGNNFYLDDTALAEGWYPCPYASLGPDASSTACTGSIVTYELTLTNMAPAADTFDLSVAGNAWPTTPIPAQLVLGPGASGQVTVSVELPWITGADTAIVTATGATLSDSATLATMSDTVTFGAWESIDAISSPGRSRPAAATVDGKIYLFGGEISGTPNREDTVEMFDPTVGVWVDMLGLIPTPASNICAVAIGTDIYIPGGLDTASVYLTTLQVYDTIADAWETIATDPLPVAKVGAGCAAAGGKLYVFGGQTTGGVYTATVHVYDPAAAAGSRWTALPDMAYARAYLAGVAVGGKVYAVGGRDSVTADFTYVEAFDPANGLWHTVTPMSFGRGGAGAMVFGDLLVACGGGWSSYRNSCESYDTTQGYAGAWAAVPQTMIQGRRTYAYASLPDALYAVAGFNGTFLSTAERMPISLCALPPSIDVSPLTLGATQPPNSTTGQPLTISNTGGADLTWSLVEEPGGGGTLCAAPTDVPWLSALETSGTVAGGASTTFDVLYDSTGLADGVYTAYLCVLSNDPDPGPGNGTELVVVPVTLTVETPQVPSISLVKTVGTTDGVCAATTEITVPAGTTVYYCYAVTNTGNVTLSLHDLVDDQMGSLFTGLNYDLTPGSSVNTVAAGLSFPAVINADTTNIGTWTAYNVGGANQVTAQASATVNVQQQVVVTVVVGTPGGGTVSGAGSYNVGDMATVQAFPTAGWVFLHWLVNSTEITDNPYTFEVMGDTTLTAIFQRQVAEPIPTTGTVGLILLLGLLLGVGVFVLRRMV